AFIVLPVYCAFAAWALYQRVDQYSWSYERLWAAYILFIISCFSVSYAALLIKERTRNLRPIYLTNKIMALVLGLSLLLVNSPLLDFYAIAANSQMKRVLANIDDINENDLRYIRFDLGRSGSAAVESLLTHPEIMNDKEKKNLVQQIIDAKDRWSRAEVEIKSLEEIAENIRFYPQGTEPPADVIAVLQSSEYPYFHCHQNPYECSLAQVELLDNGAPEYVLLFEKRYIAALLLIKTQTGWKTGGSFQRVTCRPNCDYEDALANGDYGFMDAPLGILRIGESHLSLQPTEELVRIYLDKEALPPVTGHR
ncbi:MAG: DUF4153 domain-containing protein, partial [Gammaproteobacteria bacterium]|nr:DUF4153 domain-containing protein [Gammaproteobacteria bacterium]